MNNAEKELYVINLYRGNNILGISLLCVSIMAVLLAMFIFSSFVSLQNVRTLLIKNLLVSFLFQDFLTLVLQALVYFARTMKIPDVRCFFRSTAFCETLVAVSKYTTVSSLMWLLVLALYQWKHLTPWYDGRRRLLLICVLGWGLPSVPTAAWATNLALTHKIKCWNGHSSLPSIWIIEGSKFGILFLVMLFLCLTTWKLFERKRDIISLDEVLRRRAEVRQCVYVFVWICVGQVTHSVSAHAPLHPDIQFTAAMSYVVTLLISTHGFIASLCFCFLEKDVREALQTTSESV